MSRVYISLSGTRYSISSRRKKTRLSLRLNPQLVDTPPRAFPEFGFFRERSGNGGVCSEKGLRSEDRLPFAPQAKSEFEYVAQKPLGDGFKAVPVREIHINLMRPFSDARVIAAPNGTIASGYTRTNNRSVLRSRENRLLERVMGVSLRSFAGFSVFYRFRQ